MAKAKIHKKSRRGPQGDTTANKSREKNDASAPVQQKATPKPSTTAQAATLMRAATGESSPGGSTTAHAANTLQRSVGNARLGRMVQDGKPKDGQVQARLEVSRVGDPHELEADRVADSVTSGHAPQPISRYVSPEARRMTEGADDKPVQNMEEEKPVQSMVGEEKPTQAMAEEEKPAQTMNEEEKPTQAMAEEEKPAQAMNEEEKPAQTMNEEEKPPQAMAEEEKKPVHMTPEEEQPAQANAEIGGDSNSPGEMHDPGLEARVRAPGGGRPLPEGIRGSMERATGHDLTDVRLHDTPKDRADARRLKARAFARGKHIWLGPGQSSGDARLLAHELTHVVQQGSAGRKKKDDDNA